MIHELIDPKKKTGKNSATTNAKTLEENCAFEQSDSETVKEPDSASTTFIPPWLRNSLGLIQRHNQSHAGFDQKSAKIIPRFKEQNHNEFDSLKKNLEQSSCTKVSDHLEILPNDSGGEGADGVESCCDNGEKQMAVFWSTRQKESETESTCTNAELKILRREDSKMTNTDVRTSAEIGKLKDEERRRLKFIKQRNKIRKRIMSEHRTGYSRKNEVDFLLEMKARQVLDDYMRKEVHSAPSDTKLLEAKLILLSGKCHDVDNSALTQQEILLLQEIKEKAGNKEEFEKLMEHVRESNLKEIMRNSESLSKALGEKARKCEEKEEKSIKDGGVQNKYEDGKSNADKDSLISTDDENDIKRFSEFLSKNKNMDEKRKCLEEVRNYFERKRRTRLTKRRHMDESKTPRQINSTERRDEPTKDRPKTKEICTMTLGREKKSKFGLCDEGIVEKAVSETLQKFVDLYHFHISPTVMGSMRRNILQALQNDSLDASNSRHNLPGLGEFKLSEGKRTEKLCLVKEDALLDAGQESERKDQQICDFTDPDVLMNKSVLSNLRDIRRKTFKTLMESSAEQANNKPERESDLMENESMKRLKKELESFSNSIQARADVAKLKLQSIILKREDQNCLSKSVQCVYNFAKKALEFHKADMEAGEQAAKGVQETKAKKDGETQTVQDCETVKKNVKSQTADIFEVCEKSLQTEEKACVGRDVQTESENVAVTEVEGVSLCPGLYRVLGSKEGGRFYLHPEKLDDDSKSETVLGKSVSSASKVSDPDSKPKFSTREKTWKERRIILREKERGKGRKSKKGYLLGSSQSRRVTRKEPRNSKIFNNSISCLFFRNFSNRNASNCFSEGLARRESEFAKESTVKEVEDSPKENHAGCAWFWNGKKITAGFDFKNHVEDLLKEKLKEIESNSERLLPANETLRTEVCSSKNEGSPGENCPTVPSKDSGRNLEIKNTNATICLRTSLDSQEEPAPFIFAAESGRSEFNDKTLPNEGPINKEEANEETVSFKEGKSVRDASTQNSQQTFLSLNITKVNSRSKTSSVDKISKSEHRKGKVSVKPLREANLRKTSDIAKAVRELKRMKIEVDDNTVESGSTFEDSLPSSVTKSYEDSPTPVAELKNKVAEEVAAVDAEDKIKSANGAIDRECQTKGGSDCEAENRNEGRAQGPEAEDYKHWELIESVLSRVNQKERQSLWNDLRQFIKTKIGRDIDDEGAKEVCIEIEQDMPKAGKGKSKNAVQARGHYTRNEGDVEVEIDLTLDDLESILRHRQRRNRRRQICRGGKTRRHVSSSSGQSDFTRADLRRYRKYLDKFVAGKEMKKKKKKRKENRVRFLY